jgi:hypothetical protein
MACAASNTHAVPRTELALLVSRQIQCARCPPGPCLIFLPSFQPDAVSILPVLRHASHLIEVPYPK